jgi:hypothetical protein
MITKNKHGVYTFIYTLAAVLLLFSVYCADYDLLETGLPAPPDPVDLKITSISDSSVTINWTRCENDSFLNYIVLYSPGSYVGAGGPVFDTLTFAADTFITVKPLADLTQYAFRVKVTLMNGASTPSPIAVTTTPENLNGKLKLTWIPDSTGALLLWTKSVTPSIQYRIFSDTTATVDSTDTLTKIVIDTTYRISDLIPGKKYWYRVYARNELSFVAVSNIVEVLFTLVP